MDGYMEGQGKFINKEGIIYEGEWKKGERCGKGRETKRIIIYIVIIIADDTYYEGEWLNNLKHGIGKVLLPNGKIREGEWKKGQHVRWIQ